MLLEKYSVDRWSQSCLKVVSSSSEKRAGGTSWGFTASGSGQLTFIDRKMTSQVYQVILQQDLSSTGTQKLSGSTGQWSKSRTKSTIKYPIWYDPVLTSTWLACFGKTSREWFTPDIPKILLNWNDCVKRKHFFPTLPCDCLHGVPNKDMQTHHCFCVICLNRLCLSFVEDFMELMQKSKSSHFVSCKCKSKANEKKNRIDQMYYCRVNKRCCSPKI